MKNLISLILDKFKKTYVFEGMVQFEDNKPVVCGDSATWLDPITVKDFNISKATTKAFRIYEEKYPEYKDYIGIW